MVTQILKGLVSTGFCFALLLPIQTSTTYASGLSAAGISPTRIVVPASHRSASVTLTNTSSVEIAYRMTLIEMGLDADGQFNVLQDDQLPDAHRSVKPIIRFSPRQVRLKPGASQVVRAIVRRSAIPGAGEFRSHLRLQALPVLSVSDLNDASSGDSVLVQSSANIEVGVTIPVIVRHGDTDARVTLNQVKLNFDRSGNTSVAELLLGLTGDRSTFGDISISLVNGNKEIEIGKLRAFALYYPYPQEWVNVELNNSVSPDDIRPDSKIRVQFENKSVDSAKVFWLDDSIKPLVIQP